MICPACREPHQPGDCEDAARPERLYRSCFCQHHPRAVVPPNDNGQGDAAQVARRRGSSWEMTLGRDLLTDEEKLSFTVGHETSHIVQASTARRGAVVGFLLLNIIAVPVLIGGGAVLGSRWDIGQGAPAGALAGLLGWLYLVYAPYLRRVGHGREFTADAYAAQHGHPLTPALAGQYRAKEKSLSRLGAAMHLNLTHPTWTQRLTHVRSTRYPGGP